MKLWYQSASPYRYQPVYDDYGRSLEEQCRKIARPDTKVHVEGTRVMPVDIAHRKYLPYYAQAQTLNCMIKAEQQGYDAFVIGCALDTGLEEGRSLVDMPVVGIAEAGYHLAAMLGNLFAVLTNSSSFFELCSEQVSKYGLQSKYLPGPYMYEAPPQELAAALKDPFPIMEKYKAAAEKAVDDGASIIIPSPIFITSLFNRTGVQKIGDAVILDSISVAVKTAEMLADLRQAGICPSSRIGVYARPDHKKRKQELMRLQKVFKIDF